MSEDPASIRSVYLSASTARADELMRCADDLRLAGIEVTCRWPWHIGELDPESAAAADLADLARADTLVSFTQGPGNPHQGRGGRHVELGVALGRDMGVMLVGPPEHAFHHLAAVRSFPSWESAFHAITGRPRTA
jgi:hypothetical protein